MYDQALERGDPTTADAAKAFALAPVYGALDAVGPAQALTQGLKRGLGSGNPVKRILGAAAVGGASEVPQEAAQTAMELSFRPDIPVQQKMEQIVDAGLTGGAVGGLFGGIGGIRGRAPKIDPNATPTEDLGGMVDQLLQPQGPPERQGPPDPLAALRQRAVSGQATPEELQTYARQRLDPSQQGPAEAPAPPIPARDPSDQDIASAMFGGASEFARTVNSN
jgi:hypothetical protein